MSDQSIQITTQVINELLAKHPPKERCKIMAKLLIENTGQQEFIPREIEIETILTAVQMETQLNQQLPEPQQLH